MFGETKEEAFKRGVAEGIETGEGRDQILDIMPIPDFDGTIEASQRGNDIGAAIKNNS